MSNVEPQDATVEQQEAVEMKEPDYKYKFDQLVKVLTGFYKGTVGIVVDAQFDPKNGQVYYFVSMESEGLPQRVRIPFKEETLVSASL